MTPLTFLLGAGSGSSLLSDYTLTFWSSQSFALPYAARVRAWLFGAGGSGAALSGAVGTATGGGGGEHAFFDFGILNAGLVATLTIGAPGASATLASAGVAAGNAGGAVTIALNSLTITANGGQGGLVSTSANSNGGPGGTGGAGTATFRAPGGRGGAANFLATFVRTTGGGAAGWIRGSFNGGDAISTGATSITTGGAGVGGNGGSVTSSTVIAATGGGGSSGPAQDNIVSIPGPSRAGPTFSDGADETGVTNLTKGWSVPLAFSGSGTKGTNTSPASSGGGTGGGVGAAPGISGILGGTGATSGAATGPNGGTGPAGGGGAVSNASGPITSAPGGVGFIVLEIIPI